jgi:hypothetical protein
MTYLSRPSTASPASAISTLGARLALKQANLKHAEVPAPSSGIPRPLLSPALRRVLYSTTSSIKINLRLHICSSSFWFAKLIEFGTKQA